MKQNGQWLSHVCTRSNTALVNSRPSGAPSGLSITTLRSRPPRRSSRSTCGPSTCSWYAMTSRTGSPLTLVTSSPASTPARAAGDPGATACTRAVSIGTDYGLDRVVPVPVEKVLLAEPRGFCAGVEMAIKALAWMVRAFEPPVYCYHEIVHNRLVVDRFRDQGVIFVDDVSAVPPGAPLMLSAHGSAPDVVDAARAHGRYVVNAVCPLVTKVHHEAKVRARKGFTILYVGHAGHDDAVGTIAVAPDAMRLGERADDLAGAAASVSDPERVAVLAQTTLAQNEWSAVVEETREQFPSVWTASRNDLCFATTNRQEALTEIAQKADAVVVIGSANSSNTIALTK